MNYVEAIQEVMHMSTEQIALEKELQFCYDQIKYNRNASVRYIRNKYQKRRDEIKARLKEINDGKDG